VAGFAATTASSQIAPDGSSRKEVVVF